jgi:hypothetical protein
VLRRHVALGGGDGTGEHDELESRVLVVHVRLDVTIEKKDQLVKATRARGGVDVRTI